MSEVDDQLPFGTVDEQNISDSPNDPLQYAECEFDNGHLMWNGDEFPSERTFVLVYDEDGERTAEEIDRDRARRMLIILNKGEWTYAE